MDECVNNTNVNVLHGKRETINNTAVIKYLPPNHAAALPTPTTYTYALVKKDHKKKV